MGPKWFWTIQILLVEYPGPIVLNGSNLFWPGPKSGPNHFGQVQIVIISTEKSYLNPTKTNWTRSKQLVLNKHDLNHFGPIEGQGIIYSFFIRTRLRSISRKDNNKIHCAMKLLFHLSRSSWWSGLSWRLPLASGLAIVTSRGPQPFSQIPKSQPILSK